VRDNGVGSWRGEQRGAAGEIEGEGEVT